MFSSSQRLSVSWLCICLASIGAAYCTFQVLPTLAPLTGGAPLAVEIPCPGAGCSLFQDFAVYGISLWWAGVAYFLSMMLFCLKRAHGFALFMATAALLADAVLIIIMLLTAACVACLGGAAIVGLLFLALRSHMTARVLPAPGPSFVFLVWCGLFIAAVASAATEFVEPWDIADSGDQNRRIYFSPSCPACRDAITVFAGNAAFIPVAEKDSDYAAIRVMHEEIQKGSTIAEALRASDTAKGEPFSLETVIFRLKLLRNKAEVLKLGFDKLPLIMINGIPHDLRPQPQNAGQSSRGTAGSAALPPELSVIDACGGNTPEPCDPPLTPAPLPEKMTPAR